MSANAASALRSAKNLLRKEIKARLKQLSNHEKQRQSAIVTEMLLKHPKYESSQRVSLFLSMTDELQTLDILKHALAAHKHCFIPRYVGSSMDMVRLHSMEDYDALPETAWKIKQPADDDTREDALDTGGLDLVLMPGLGFSVKGARLGRGKGYYDTYLTKCEAKYGNMPYTIALAYKEQICEDVPMDTHDRLLDEVLFES